MTHSHRATFQKEMFAEVIEEIRPLLQQHWKEIALYQPAIHLDPDENVYRAIESAGGLRIYTARAARDLIGYAVFFVRTHPHYKTKLWATSDIFWIKPKTRRTYGWSRCWRTIRHALRLASKSGISDRLFEFAEADLRQEGAHVIHITTKVSHPAAGIFLRGRNYRHVEHGFSKILNS